jgi:hypothetical protein
MNATYVGHMRKQDSYSRVLGALTAEGKRGARLSAPHPADKRFDREPRRNDQERQQSDDAGHPEAGAKDQRTNCDRDCGKRVDEKRTTSCRAR